jgi:hypothetical protein
MAGHHMQSTQTCKPGCSSCGDQTRFLLHPARVWYPILPVMSSRVAGIAGDYGWSEVWGAYLPLFIGACLTLRFMRGLFRPWGLFR